MRRAILAAALLTAGCGGAAPSSPAPAPKAPAGPSPPSARHVPRDALGGLLRAGLPVYCGGSRRRLVALTFDDGPGVYTRLALKELRRAHVRATFFLVGKSIHSYPAWPRRERALAALGDHTETHPLLPRLPAAAMVRELADGQRDAHQASGASVRLFRPPYGATNAAITAAAKRLGMVEVLWSIDSGDSISGDFHAISARVRRAVRPGSIVLMHENRGQTIRALRSLLPYLRRRHLHPVSVPELLAVDPPSPARLRAGAAGCTRA